MIIKKLIIENLRSYEKQEINFPRGSVLLSGDVGSGKTTVLLAIEFALFGLQTGQKASSLLRSSADAGSVILNFEIDGKEVSIKRTLKKGKKSISQDYSSLTIDNEKFEGSITEIKDKILRLLNYPPEFNKKTDLLYKFTVYTPQEEMKQIILESGDVRLNTLRHVFGIDKYKRIQENAGILASRLRERIRSREDMIHNLEEDKKNLEARKNNLIDLREKEKEISDNCENLTELRKQKEKLLNEIQEKINEKKFFENEKSKSQILFIEKNQQISTLEKEINSINLQIEEARKLSFNPCELDLLKRDIESQKMKEEKIQREYMNITSEINSKQFNKSEAESLRNKISRLEKCPTCLQQVSDEYKHNIFNKTEEEIQKSQKAIDELYAKKNQAEEQMNSIKKIMEEFKKKESDLNISKLRLESLKEKEQRVLAVEKQRELILKDLDLLKKHIKSIEDSILDYEKYEGIYKGRQVDLESSRIEENNHLIKKAEIKKDIQFSEEQIKEYENQINEKEILRKGIEKLKEIEYWISNKFLDLVLFTERQVMLNLNQEFSKLFSRWFSILVSEELSAKLDDDFSPIIEQQDYELDYSFLSGGERTAIALAYRLSLNQIINSLLSNIRTRDLVILDEPTDGFSAQQLDKMKDVLSQLKVEQLILVSHEPKMEGFVENIIKLKKEGGTTKFDE